MRNSGKSADMKGSDLFAKYQMFKWIFAIRFGTCLIWLNYRIYFYILNVQSINDSIRAEDIQATGMELPEEVNANKKTLRSSRENPWNSSLGKIKVPSVAVQRTTRRIIDGSVYIRK